MPLQGLLLCTRAGERFRPRAALTKTAERRPPESRTSQRSNPCAPAGLQRPSAILKFAGSQGL
jgi:hypothetical protein